MFTSKGYQTSGQKKLQTLRMETLLRSAGIHPQTLLTNATTYHPEGHPKHTLLHTLHSTTLQQISHSIYCLHHPPTKKQRRNHLPNLPAYPHSSSSSSALKSPGHPKHPKSRSLHTPELFQLTPRFRFLSRHHLSRYISRLFLQGIHLVWHRFVSAVLKYML